MWNDAIQLPQAALNELEWPLQKPIVMALTDYQLLVIEGPDAEKFLQGQCTCDFRRLAEHEWVRGAHCNAKGRMHSSFITAKLGEQRIGLRVHTSIAELAREALAKYIVFSKAEAILGKAALIGVLDPNQPDLSDYTSQALPETGKFTSNGSETLLRLTPQCLEIWLTEASVTTSAAQFPGTWATMKCWQEFMLRQGIAEVTAASQGQLLPQELNYQLIDGISFDKGCYTGQEIVARMHYRGKLKKHLYLAELTLPDGVLCDYGLELEAAGKPVGKVIDSVTHDDGKTVLLALANDDALQHECVLRHSSQPILQWQTLPYAIPNEKV